jgi:P22 tail accessory factor
MTTTVDIVGSALRKAGVLDSSEPVQPADFDQAVSALNRMMMRWEAKGINTGWSPVALPSDIIPAPIEAEDAIIYNLALVLAPEYGAQIGADVASVAQGALVDLKNSIYVTSSMHLNTDMPNSNRSRRWNMYTDSPADGPGWNR